MNAAANPAGDRSARHNANAVAGTASANGVHRTRLHSGSPLCIHTRWLSASILNGCMNWNSTTARQNAAGFQRMNGTVIASATAAAFVITRTYSRSDARSSRSSHTSGAARMLVCLVAKKAPSA